MIIERRLKYIKFNWCDDEQDLIITTLQRNPDDTFYVEGVKDGLTDQKVTGIIRLNKTYLFSTMRFMISVAQRMTRGFPAWVKKQAKRKSS